MYVVSLGMRHPIDIVQHSCTEAKLRHSFRNRVYARRPNLLTPIPYIVPARIFAAIEKSLDPDRPRTLSKVTLTLSRAPPECPVSPPPWSVPEYASQRQ